VSTYIFNEEANQVGPIEDHEKTINVEAIKEKQISPEELAVLTKKREEAEKENSNKKKASTDNKEWMAALINELDEKGKKVITKLQADGFTITEAAEDEVLMIECIPKHPGEVWYTRPLVMERIEKVENGHKVIRRFFHLNIWGDDGGELYAPKTKNGVGVFRMRLMKLYINNEAIKRHDVEKGRLVIKNERDERDSLLERVINVFR
jgi:hypothetical protein